ncbi:MAG: flavin reductase family protein, partial [Xanthobacteraceae bacterium]
MDAPPHEPREVAFDFHELSARDKYKLMIGTVVPRPIALVTTVDPQGRVNAAPFSFFNCLSADPPILALGVENHPDMRFKDTGLNIRLTEVFTVNIVSRAIAEAMHLCAVPFPPEHDELQAA